jgi:hypothetical protein
MRPFCPIFRGLWLGWLACASQASGQTILADDAMANYATNANASLTGSAIPAGPELYVGRKAYYSNPNSNHLLHLVVPFQLPELGPGTFTEVRVAFRAQGGGTWNIPIHLWAIPGSRATSATQGGDVRSTTLNHTEFGSLVMPGFFHRDTIRDSHSQTPAWGAEASRLAAWLNAAYQDGANQGRFIFMRLSPQALTPAAAGPDEEDSGFAVGAKGFVNAQWRPYITYNFVEAPAGSPVVGGFSVSDDEVGETDPVTLSWSVTGATSVAIWPEVGTVAATGTAVVTPGSTTTYTLHANNASGERIATTGVTVKPAAVPEVPAELYDGNFKTAPSTGAVVGNADLLSDTRVSVGRRAGGTNVDHMVIPFRLPDLGPGVFRNVTLTVDVGAGDGATPGIDINLFGLPDARELPVPLATDVNAGGQDHRGRGTLIELAWINDTTPVGALATAPNGGISSAISGWLTDAYANGTNAGKFAFLRLSPAALAPAQATGVRIAAANGAAASRPLLTYEFLPNGLLPPAIGSFAATPASISTGWSTTLAWSVGGGASTVSISPGIGTVPASGSREVAPHASTTYTLTATNASGTRTRTLAVGVGPFRYFRFVPVAVRAGTTVQISEFQLMKSGTRLTGATATNPGGNNPGSEGPEQANDDLTTTKWLDFNMKPLVFDFGAPTVADGYRFATANDADTRDPVSWRVEGSHDGTSWRVLDEKSGFATPTPRFTSIATQALPFVGDTSGTAGAATIASFTSSVQTINSGQSATLSWSVLGAPSAILSPGIGPLPASGSLVVTPAATTTYSLAAMNGSGAATASVRIVVQPACRWFRFVPVKTRTPSAAIALAEFGMLAGSTPLVPVAATNPGGGSAPGYEPSNAIDDDFYSSWTDPAKQPLVLDFGTAVVASGYRFAPAGTSSQDPVSWRVEGSANGSNWVVVDTRTDYPTPLTSEEFVAPFSLPEPPEAAGSQTPETVFFSLGPDRSQATLVWTSRPGTNYTIETSTTLVIGSWTPVEAAIPADGSMTSRTFFQTLAARRFFRVKTTP